MNDDYYKQDKNLSIITKIQRKWKLKIHRGRLAKQYRKRRNIITEIVSTEEEYVHKLQVMLEVFKPQIQKKGVITDKQLDKLFGNIGIIYNINKSLLDNLRQIPIVKKRAKLSSLLKKETVIEVGNKPTTPTTPNTIGNGHLQRRKSLSQQLMTLLQPDKTKESNLTRFGSKAEISKTDSKLDFSRNSKIEKSPIKPRGSMREIEHTEVEPIKPELGKIQSKTGTLTIGEVFKKISPFLKVYSLYFTNYKDSNDLLTELRNTNATFANLLKHIKQNVKEVNKMDLVNFMIAPIQRIPRYQMILNDLLDNTPLNHYDYHDLVKCVELIQDVNKILDRNAKGKHGQQVIEELSQIYPNLVQPFRRLIKFGKLQYIKENVIIPCELDLFTDIIVLRYETSNVRIHSILIETQRDMNEKRFILTSVIKEEEEPMTFETETEDECVDWINDIVMAKQVEIKKLSIVFERPIHMRDILFTKTSCTKELINKMPNFEKLYDFRTKAMSDLEGIQKELYDYYKNGVIGLQSVLKNEEEKIQLNLKLEDCNKRINSGAIILYRLQGKLQEVDSMLLCFLRNEEESFKEYFGERVKMDLSHLTEFVEAREDFVMDPPDVILKKIAEMDVDIVSQVEIRIQQTLLKHTDLNPDVLDLLEYVKVQFKNSQFLVNASTQHEKSMEIEIEKEKKQVANLIKENEVLIKELKQKKELLDHVAKEKRKSQKTLQELEPTHLLKRISDLEDELKHTQEKKKSSFLGALFKK